MSVTRALPDTDFDHMVFHTPQCEVTDRAVSYCCSSLNGLPEQLMPLAVQSFVRCLREELKTTDTYLYRKVLDNLASCMEDFSLGMMKSNIFYSNMLSIVLHLGAEPNSDVYIFM